MNLTTLRAGRLLTTLLLCATFLLSTIAFTVPIHAMPGSITTTRYAPTTTALKIVSGNASTTSVSIVNIGSVTAFLGTTSAVTGSVAASTDGAPLLAGNTVTYGSVTNNIYAITASGTAELRVTVATGGASIGYERLQVSGISNGAANTTVMCSDGTNAIACTPLVYNVTTAITANSTATATAAGTYAITSSATGRGLLFVSDASLWQLATNPTIEAASAPSTIATTSTTDQYIIAPVAGTLTTAYFTSVSALSASDTNYFIVSIINLGAAAGGSTNMLSTAASNGTQTTGGTALTAFASRTLVLSGTGSALVVAAGDVLRVRFTVTGTLAGAVTGSQVTLRFARLS